MQSGCTCTKGCLHMPYFHSYQNSYNEMLANHWVPLYTTRQNIPQSLHTSLTLTSLAIQKKTYHTYQWYHTWLSSLIHCQIEKRTLHSLQENGGQCCVPLGTSDKTIRKNVTHKYNNYKICKIAKIIRHGK